MVCHGERVLKVTVIAYLKDKNSGDAATFYEMPINFPKTGEIPMMVAVNVSKLWMYEQKSIEKMPDSFLNDNDYSYSE